MHFEKFVTIQRPYVGDFDMEGGKFTFDCQKQCLAHLDDE
jgi:hypothetical protein